MTLVVDASMAGAWLLPEEDSDAAEAIFATLWDVRRCPRCFGMKREISC